MSKCSEVMTKNPVVCKPSDLVANIAQVMKKENIGLVPIVEDVKTRKLVGMVTDRDLAVKVVAESRDLETTKAEEVMSRRVVSCRTGDDLQKALDAMSENQFRRIPVIDDEDRIVGIIAQADIATRVHEPEKTATLVEKISKPKVKKVK